MIMIQQGVNKIINGVIQNINPSTGELLHPAVAMTTPSELSGILSRANAAQRNSWGNLPLSTRISLLRESITRGVQPISQQLAETITNEMGKILSESHLEVEQAVGLRGAWLDLVGEANEDISLVGHNEDDDGKEEDAAESVIVRDPLGVVAVLSPWNVSFIFPYKIMEIWLFSFSTAVLKDKK